MKLIDALGNAQYVRKAGRMTLTKHASILSALEKRAERYRRGVHNIISKDEALYREAIALDETETVVTSSMTDSDDDSVSSGANLQEQNYSEIEGIAKELLTVQGQAPGPKSEGTVRLAMENPNGLGTRIAGNDKLEKAKELADELELDLLALTEHRINPRHRQNKNGLAQMFKGGESEVRAQVGHNAHENISRVQEGGVGLLLYGPLIEQYDFEASGNSKDATGLGRWAVMVFRGTNGLTTRVVCGYNPCYSGKKGLRTTYQQHRRYFLRRHKDKTCPRRKFREDLVKQLQTWREQGDRLIVCLDANENIYKKAIGKALTDADGLSLVEVVGSFTDKRVGPTFFRGRTPIDAI